MLAAHIRTLVCLPLSAAILLPSSDAPLFVESASSTGLAFTHVNGATGEYYMPEVMGAGVALFDYDADGDLDVFLVQGGPLTATPASPTSRLFRNDLADDRDGRRQLRFTDVTARAGVGVRTYGMGAAVGDSDGDGDLDLLVTALGPETLFRNNGDGTFTDVTAQAGIGDPLWSTSAAFADYDRDGDLDLFVANYVDFTVAGNKLCHDAIGARDYCTPRAYRPAPDRLYRNEGGGRFTNATERAGISKADGAGLGVSVGDYNRDGWLDLYVANDATPNQLWINRRDGTFVDEGLLSGSALSAAGNPEGSMGVASGDFDGDEDEDLFVTNIAGETFALYVNDGRGNFDDARVRTGVARPTAAFTGFGTDWFDYDNDGWLDLFVANGAVNIIEQQRGQPVPYRMKNQLFKNTGSGGSGGSGGSKGSGSGGSGSGGSGSGGSGSGGSGSGGSGSGGSGSGGSGSGGSGSGGSGSGGSGGPLFEETSASAGAAFAVADVGRGAAFGDIDNDGDIDIVTTNNNGPARLLINQGDHANHWLQVRLQQASGDRFALGARIGIEREGRPPIWRRVKTDGSYLSASDVRVHVGLGASPSITAVVVQWPDGQRERFTGVHADRIATLRRGSGRQ